MPRCEPAVFDPVACHTATAQPALVRLPKKHRRGRRTLIRTDFAGGAHGFLSWFAK